MSKEVKIGTARYGGNKRKHWKLKDGESVFRILPPLFSLAEKGRWSVFYNIHFGYKNSKGQLKPFQSPLVMNRKTKMVEVPDAAMERIQLLKAKLEEAKKAGATETVKKLLELVGGPKSRFNLDSNHHMTVIDEQGNIGTLRIRHRCKLALDATIKELKDKGVDPLSLDNGRFFVFHRSGNALDTTFKVTVKQNKLNVPGVGEVFQDVVHKITPDIIARLSEEAEDLDKLFKRPTAEEVARIVKEGPTAVDEILDSKEEEKEADIVYEDEYGVSTQETTASQPVTAPMPPVMPQAPVTPAVTVTPAVAAATPVATVAPVTPVVTAPEVPVAPPVAQVVVSNSEPKKTTAQVISDMSVEDFLKTLDS